MGRQRLRRIRNCVVGILLATVLAGVFVVLKYPAHVEHEFEVLMGVRGHGRPHRVLSSACLGERSDRIRLLPILQSKLLGKHPLNGNRQVTYFHGYWFNYRKWVSIVSTQRTAWLRWR